MGMNLDAFRTLLDGGLRNAFQEIWKTPEDEFLERLPAKGKKKLADWQVAQLAVEWDVDPKWGLSAARMRGVLRK